MDWGINVIVLKLPVINIIVNVIIKVDIVMDVIVKIVIIKCQNIYQVINAQKKKKRMTKKKRYHVLAQKVDAIKIIVNAIKIRQDVIVYAENIDKNECYKANSIYIMNNKIIIEDLSNSQNGRKKKVLINDILSSLSSSSENEILGKKTKRSIISEDTDESNKIKKNN